MWDVFAKRSNIMEDQIDKAQIHYISNISQKEYLNSNDGKKMIKAIELCGSGNKVLDIGSGGGYIALEIKKHNNGVTCLDLQPQAIADAKKKGLKGVVGKAQSLPFKDNTFDVVFMAEVIEHFLDTQKALMEVRRVLKRNGTIIITTPNFNSFRDRILLLFGKLQAYAYHVDHVKLFNKERLVRE